MPGCSSAQSSVASVQRGSGLSVCDFLTVEMYSSWRVGSGAPIIFSAVLTVHCTFLLSDLVAEPNQIVTEARRTGSKTAENCISSSRGKFNHRLAWKKLKPKLFRYACQFCVLYQSDALDRHAGHSASGPSEVETTLNKTIIAFSFFKQCRDHDI